MIALEKILSFFKKKSVIASVNFEKSAETVMPQKSVQEEVKMLILEKEKYDQFTERFTAGEFGLQRFGQAFYDFFRLAWFTQNPLVVEVYQAPDNDVKELISQFIVFK